MPANHVVLASGAVVAVSVAVAAAIAMYESPELRRYADDVRRKIAVAIHSLGDGINPPHREPLFNRPEDLDGFLESRRGAGAEPGVDADEETRRRQREELLYWNSKRLSEVEEKKGEDSMQNSQIEEQRPRPSHRGSSFDDFLSPDENAERGTYVFNSGSEVRSADDGLRRRGDGARGFSSSVYANPFADEFNIGVDELEDESTRHIAPTREEDMSDIYSASETHEPRTISEEPLPILIDVDTEDSPETDSAAAPPASLTESSATLEGGIADDEYVTAGQDDRDEAYASIQAWAETSNPSFYSPLPVTPVASVSAVSEADAEIQSVSEGGDMTPTDSMSVIDAADVESFSRDGDNGRLYDIMSESEGVATPGSWSEVGSVISENDVPLRA